MTDSSDTPVLPISAEKFASLFAGGSANVKAERALEALTAEEAIRGLEGYPHSVAEIVAHLQFWQAWMLARLAGDELPFPKHAGDGWPVVAAKDWEDLRTKFFEGLASSQALARNPENLSQRAFDGQTTAEALLDGASHTIYHLGQIVTVRRALGLWPPPSGGDSW